MGVKVSVILPTFNRRHSLPAAMASVLGQSERDLELIVVDDASTEQIEDLVYASGDPRVRYLRRPCNGGAAAARNTGLAQARGDFIAFQDSDDLWLPGKLERQLTIFATLPESVGAVTGSKIVYGCDNGFVYGPSRVCIAPDPKGILQHSDQLTQLLNNNRISVQNALFRRGCYPAATWFDPLLRANEDWDFAVRLARHTHIYEDAEPVVLGFVSPDSISRSRRRETVGLLRIIAKNRDMLANNQKLRAEMLLRLGASLSKLGRRQMAWRLLLASIWLRPANALIVARGAVKLAGRLAALPPSPLNSTDLERPRAMARRG